MTRTTELESDIEKTRDRMGDGIEAIGEKLRPERIKQQAKEAVSRKTREAGASLWRTAKENPVPTAIVALGLTLLFRARKQHNGNGYENGGEGVRERAQELAHNAGDKVSNVAHEAAAKARRTGNTLQNFFQDNPVIAGAGAVVLGAAVGALLPGTEKENRMMGHARDEMVREVKNVASQAQDTMKQTLSENQYTQSQGAGYDTRQR